jgi:hypothetical protein
MDAPQYTPNELRIMSLMAHGVIREAIARRMGKGFSQSTVTRTARLAADKAGGGTIVHGVAIMVAQGLISVRYGGQKDTAQHTAEHWLITKMMSCLDWQEFTELRAAYTGLTSATHAATREDHSRG